MCGRFSLTSSLGAILDHFGSGLDSSIIPSPRFNISPTQDIAIIRAGTPRLELREARWGLVPHWAKGIEPGFSMFNARAETVESKPAFRSLIKRRRCLVPADGFFEWQQIGGAKRPWRIFMKRGLFAFAGLWDRWQGPGGQVIESATIITTDANDLVRPIHDRMPVILDPADYAFWLDSGIQDPEALRPLLVPHSVAGMDAYLVTPRLGKATYQAPDAITPLQGTVAVTITTDE